MALFNSFQFGDVDSKDYGVYISGDSVYDSPARSVDLVQVPGRNGALALDNGYYENIEVTYPAGSFGTSQEEWREKMLGIRNALAAQRGYQKLIDTYHPEHYRLGMFFAGISASPVQYNRAGQFPIRFNCKPQRFLISGDEAVEFTEEGQEEVYGPSNIVSFEATEGAEIRQLEVDLEPIQDLNGYDNPWPAGGGRNKLPMTLDNMKSINTAGTWSGNAYVYAGVTYTVNTDEGGNVISIKANGTASAYSLFRLYNELTLSADMKLSGCASGGSLNGYRLRAESNDKSYQDIGNGVAIPSGTALTRTVIVVSSGAQVSNGIFYPMLRLSTDSDTSFAPPSNICPISGHTEVNVYRTGKNLWHTDFTNSGGGLTKHDGEMEVNVSRVTNTTYLLGGSAISDFVGYKLKSGTYTLSTHSTDFDGIYVTLSDGSTWANGETKTFLSDVTINNVRCTIKTLTAGTYTLHWQLQIELGSTATDYVPFAGFDTYSVSLGQTVYGGTLNVTTGVLTIDRAMVDLGTLTWNYRSDYAFFYTQSIAPKNNNLISSMYTALDSEKTSIQMGSAANGTMAKQAGYPVLLIKNTAYTDAATFKTAMSGVQLVYELATPTTVQLTAAEVTTLLGQNNIWSDAGEVEVKVASPVDLTNPTNFPAKPLIRIYGNGSVRVGDTIATVQNNADGYVDIDCEAMNCYDTTGGRNADVSFSGNDFPELTSGDNGILLTGPSKVEITPRWWEL